MQHDIPTLLPAPYLLKLTGGSCALSDKYLILIISEDPQSLLFSALRLQDAVNIYFHKKMEIYAGNATTLDSVDITLRLDPQLTVKSQGYELKITPTGIFIAARDEPGIFYACCTLIQLLQSHSFTPDKNIEGSVGTLSCLEIHDGPDFLNRGVMLDVSRDKVPQMDTIFNLVDLLASWKINQLQLYTEHTFAYQQHPEVWAEASPFTGEEILKLDAFCRERYIELVPNQNSFGHLEHWLKLPSYKALAEAPDGFDFPWGHHDGPFSLCPLDHKSLAFIKSLYDELLPHFSSKQFNVGSDETFDLGQGRSKVECERIGTGRVYLDYLLKIYDEVTQRGFRMQFWGDIVLAYPELVHELPKDIIALEWGYEANHPFDEHAKMFAQAGFPFYACPGTSSWNSIAGRTDNCIKNLSNAAQNGIKYGADGYLITDWGDNGHWQALPISYLGFAVGAAYAWSFEANQGMDIRDALNRYAFLDPTGDMGNMAYDLGNVYRDVGIEPENSSSLFHILQKPIHERMNFLDLDSGILALHKALNVISQVSENLSRITSLRPDKELLQREFMLTVDLLRHACMRGIYGLSSSEYTQSFLSKDLERIILEYQHVWLSRNRPGGLRDSLRYFEIAKNDYH